MVWQGGALSLTRPDRGTTSRRQARRLESQLRSWWQGEPLRDQAPIAANRFPAPALPQLSASFLRGWKAFRVLAPRAAMLFVGAIILFQVFDVRRHGFVLTMVPLLVPLCYMLAVCPLFFRKAPMG
jgi:hypothetical protein